MASDTASPWYVRWVIGFAAWITAIVMAILGAVIINSGLDIKGGFGLVMMGAAYLACGFLIVRRPERGVFLHQLAIAVTAAGAGLVVTGIAMETESLVAGFVAAVAILAGVIAWGSSRILQFLIAALAGGMYIAALLENRASWFLDLTALATPLALWLLLKPPVRNIRPTAIALLGLFPVAALMTMQNWWFRPGFEIGGTFARILHIVLFLWLVYVHWRRHSDEKITVQVAVFAVLATMLCLLLPPGGSAALLILMLAFVIGSVPLAIAGALLEGQFIVRYYYDLDISLLDKSLLMMALGVLLLGAWWMLQRSDKRTVR